MKKQIGYSLAIGSLLALVIVLTSCGIVSNPAEPSIELPGRVVDGPIENAVCFVDKNNNLQQDNKEPVALSDKNGNYLLVLPTNKLSDYANTCVYCSEGNDTDTQEALDSLVLSTPIPTKAEDITIQTNAITTMLNCDNTTPDDEKEVLAKLGIDTDRNSIISTDYYEQAQSTTISKQEKEKAEVMLKKAYELANTMLNLTAMTRESVPSESMKIMIGKNISESIKRNLKKQPTNKPDILADEAFITQVNDTHKIEAEKKYKEILKQDINWNNIDKEKEKEKIKRIVSQTEKIKGLNITDKDAVKTTMKEVHQEVSKTVLNIIPIADEVNITIDEDTSVNITLRAMDTDNDSLTYHIVSNPTKGTLSNINGSTVTYTPNPNENGTDSFSYKVNDGQSDSNSASVTIIINAVNDLPTISGEPKNIAPAGINYSFTPTVVDSDVSIGDARDTLTYSITNPPSWATFNPSTGELSGIPNNTEHIGTDEDIVISVSDEADEKASLVTFNIKVGYDFGDDNTSLKDAVDEWVDNENNATTTYGHISAWNVSDITDMSGLFIVKTTFNDDIGSWDVSNVTDMSSMFDKAYAFNKDISSWNVSKVTDMSSMFKGRTVNESLCNGEPDDNSKFNQNISDWNVANVTDMSEMFTCSQFNNGNEDLDWGKKTSKVTDMNNMFMYAQEFNQDISSWDVSSVTNMERMFIDARVFNQPISSWNVSKVTNMERMFYQASNFNQPINNWTVTAVTEKTDFCTLSGLNTSDISTSFSSDGISCPSP